MRSYYRARGYGVCGRNYVIQRTPESGRRTGGVFTLMDLKLTSLALRLVKSYLYRRDGRCVQKGLLSTLEALELMPAQVSSINPCLTGHGAGSG